MRSAAAQGLCLALLAFKPHPTHAASLAPAADSPEILHTIAAVPVITSFSPPAGPPGTAVTIHGTGFTGTVSVKFNSRSASFGVMSDSSLIATVPASATTGPITVTNPSGTDTSDASFIVGNAPVISSFSPAGGAVGTAVTITGSYLADVTAVRFNGTPAAFTLMSGTSISTSVPSGATTGPISASNPAGSGLSALSFYLPPTIAGFFPTGGPPGTNVTIYGGDFASTYRVRFAGVDASFSVKSDGVVHAVAPGGAGTGAIEVFATGGIATSPTTFFAGNAPSITSFFPGGGMWGTTVVISGSGFTGTTLVEFSGVSATYTVDADDRITAIVPVGSRTGPIGVLNPAGAAKSAADFYLNTPPLIAIDSAFATGPVVRSPGGPIEYLTVAISDTFGFDHIGFPPHDTIPARSRIDFYWHGEPRIPGTYIAGYSYKLDEPMFVSVDSSVRSVSYNPDMAGGVLQPGVKIFVVRTHDNLDNLDFQPERNRFFQMNLAPDTWFAGPDTTALDSRYGWSGHDRHFDIGDWHTLPDLTGTLLSCDSLTKWPAERAESKTFFEIYGNRLYVRSENDTVHMNSWIVLHGGGSDLDSPYHVKVEPGDPALNDTLACASSGQTKVVRPDGLNGSPIGFRSFYGELLDPTAAFISLPLSGLFPIFDPTSTFHAPTIAGYVSMVRSGKVYLVLSSVDGDGMRDSRLNPLTARLIADRVDRGVGTPYEATLRRKILTFFVNQSPVLLIDDPAFVPKPNEVFRTRTLSLHLLADDPDPLDPANPPPTVGGPSATKVLRWNVTLTGKDDAGMTVTDSLAGPMFTPDIVVEVPSNFVDPLVTIGVELCDCALCEDVPGTGRCVHYDIPVQVMVAATPTLASLIDVDATPERVRVRWQLGTAFAASVERTGPEETWHAVGDVLADGKGRVTFEDRTVKAGGRYAYRLVLSMNGTKQTAGDVWVDVPRPGELVLEGVRPNPTIGNDFTVHFSLPLATPARLELLTVSGRLLKSRDLGSMGPGRHAVALGPGARIPPGIYLLRLVQGRNSRVTRAVVLD